MKKIRIEIDKSADIIALRLVAKKRGFYRIKEIELKESTKKDIAGEVAVAMADFGRYYKTLKKHLRRPALKYKLYHSTLCKKELVV